MTDDGVDEKEETIGKRVENENIDKSGDVEGKMSKEE